MLIKQHCFVVNIRDYKFLIRLGKNLKKLRVSKNMTQEDLAYESELTLSQIARIETDRINTSICTIKAIGIGLKIDMKNLLDF